MNALAFDTLRFAKRMQEAGLPQQQAEAMAEALSAAVQDSVATKDDLNKAVSDLRVEIREVQVTIIKWLVPLLLGQTALIAALVRLL